MVTAPSVKEGLYDLCTDGVARKIWDLVEVISPEERRLLKEWHTVSHNTSNSGHVLQAVGGAMEPVRQVSISKEEGGTASRFIRKS